MGLLDEIAPDAPGGSLPDSLPGDAAPLSSAATAPAAAADPLSAFGYRGAGVPAAPAGNMTARALIARGVPEEMAAAAVQPGNGDLLRRLLPQAFGPQIAAAAPPAMPGGVAAPQAAGGTQPAASFADRFDAVQPAASFAERFGGAPQAAGGTQPATSFADRFSGERPAAGAQPGPVFAERFSGAPQEAGGTQPATSFADRFSGARPGTAGAAPIPLSPGQFVNHVVRSAATGVPVVGGLANRMDAATNATLAPALNPLLAPDNQLPDPTWRARYDHSLQLQNDEDAQFAHDHPWVDRAAKFTGKVAGMAAARRVAPWAFGEGVLSPIGPQLPSVTGGVIGGVDALIRGEPVIDGVLKGAGSAGLGSAGRGLLGSYGAPIGRRLLDNAAPIFAPFRRSGTP